MANFKLKTGDTSPAIKRQLTDNSGNPVDLTGASVKFGMWNIIDESIKIDASGTITDASNGKVKYEWQSGDTDTEARYEAEFEVTYSDSGTETFPNDPDKNIIVEIGEDII